MLKLTIKSAFVALLLGVSPVLFSQNIAVNTSGNPAVAGTVLDLSNNLTSGTNAFLAPYVTLTSSTVLAPVTGAGPAGLLVYNMNTATTSGLSGQGYYYWTGSTGTPANTWEYINNGAGSSSGWNLTGNTGINPAANYAGTTDVNPFIIKTQATERMRFLPGGGAGIGTATPKSAVDVNGNMSLGTYAGVTAAPANGMIVSGAVGIGNNAPNPSAVLDLTNTMATGGTGAALRWPTNPNPAANIAAPVVGDMVYNSTTGCFNFYNGAWVTMGCPCTSAPPAATITPSCPQSWQGSSITYTSSVTTGVTFTWSVSATLGTPIITAGQGTNSITVTWPSSGAATGTVTLSMTNMCGTTTVTQSVTINAAPTISGAASIGVSSTGNAYTCSIAGATYAWSSSSTYGTITSATNIQAITVTAASTAGSFTLSCTVSFGSCSQTTTYAVTVTSCSGAITLDGSLVTVDNYPSDLATMSLTINTTSPNELVLVTVCGYPQNASTPTMTNAGAATLIVNFFNNQATDATYGFIPTATGAHTVSCGTGSYPNYQQMMAAAFIGFCAVPTIAGDVTPRPVTLGTAPSALSTATLSTNITTAAANSYIYGVYDNSDGKSAVGTVTWTNLTKLGQTSDISYGWDMSAGGQQIAGNATVVTVTGTDTQTCWSGSAAILDLYDIH